MKEKKQAIVLLNDGERSETENHCNSWPSVTYTTELWYLGPPCPIL